MINIIGHTLAQQYEIIEEIAKGGMATVYLANQRSLGRHVAVKVLPSTFMHDETFIGRFNREVDVISRLQHPHILPVYDYGEHEDMPYIVMAYLNGGTLTEVIRGAPLSYGEILRLTKQMADALDYAHSKDIIHRDFKPGNVLLDEQKNTYLADFGLAKIAEASTELTGNAIIGTPTYMAPEQAGPGVMSPAADVYALGVSVFQMLTGRAPYEDESATVVLMAHLMEEIPNIHEFRGDLPPAVDVVIKKVLAKEVSERYQSAGEFFQDLARALNESGVTNMESSEPVPALMMTNMVGGVIFVDGQCLKLLRRHHNEARHIIGQPLTRVLGLNDGEAQNLIDQIANQGTVDNRQIEITDSKGNKVPVIFSAVATLDDKGGFIGADISLEPVRQAPTINEVDTFHTAEQHLNTREETIVQEYFTAHVDGLYDLMLEWAGKRVARNLENILNETSQRNVWAVKMTDGHITQELRHSDLDIYRALMAKAVTYAASVIGNKVVRKKVSAINKRMDKQAFEFAKRLGLHDVFEELI